MTPALAERFLGAAIDPSEWVSALRGLAQITGSDHAQLIGIGTDHAARFNWISDERDGMAATFAREGTYTPETNFRIAARQGATATTLLSEADYAAAMPMLTGEAYRDLCSDWGISLGAQIDVRENAAGMIGLALLRADATGPTDADDRAILAAARAPVTAAIELQVAIEHQGHALVAGGFEAMSAACFVLDARMRVGALTPQAEALVAAGLIRVIDGRATLPAAAADRDLGAAFAGVAAGAAARRMVVRGPTATMHCRVHRLPTRAWSLGFAPFAVLVVKRRAVGVDAAAVEQLRDLFALTRAEAEIALRLAAGDDRKTIVAARGISRETLRSHLRALFAKLEVGREAEAIHLLHALFG